MNELRLESVEWLAKGMLKYKACPGSISGAGRIADLRVFEVGHRTLRQVRVVDCRNPTFQILFPKLDEDVLQNIIAGEWTDRVDEFLFDNDLFSRSEEKHIPGVTDCDVFAWSPCGDYLALGSGMNGYLVIYGLTDKSIFVEDAIATYPGGIEELVWSNNGDYLISSSSFVEDRSIVWRCNWEVETNGTRRLIDISKLWDANSMGDRAYFNTILREVSDHARGWFGNFCPSPDGTTLIATVSSHLLDRGLVLFHVPTMAKLGFVGLGKCSVSSLSCTPSANSVFYCHEGRLATI